MNKRRLIFITICAVIAGVGLAIIQKHKSSERVEAAGDLFITYLDAPLSGPIFDLSDVKPGDCYEREIKVKNDGKKSRLVLVIGDRTGGEGTDPSLEEGLLIEISENGTILYNGGKTLAQFFADSALGLPLSTVNKNTHKIYKFKICLPEEAGNEYQKKSVVFDLIFNHGGQEKIVINEVFYDVDPAHGVDSPGDRGVVVGGHVTQVNVENNGEGSENSAFVDIENLCHALQGTTTDAQVALDLLGNTGNNQSGSNINAKKVLNVVTVNVNGGNNTLGSFCGGQLGRNHEWIELYNPGTETVNLRGWTITDNSGIEVRINGNRNLGAGKFALISKSNSTWAFWSEPFGTLKIPLGRQIGDGLDDSGDHLLLKNAGGVLIDAMSYGDDSSQFVLPDVAEGHSLEREPDGLDTNTAGDWVDQNPPAPGT